MEEFIQSKQNPRIKALAKLQERSGRKKLGLFTVEGLRELSRCLLAKIDVDEIYFCPELFKSPKHSEFIDNLRGKIPLCRVSEQAFERISNREGCDGVIGVCRQWKTSLSEISLPKDKPALILVADATEKPGNLGAIIRSADAAGASAVLVSNPVGDIFNPSVIRASQGAVFSMKVAEDTPENIFAWLKKNGIRSYAAALGATNYVWDCDFTKPSAIVMGSEKDGLPQSILNMCDEIVKLPMLGQADSLNVNIAATLIMFEFVRQNFRRPAPKL